MKYTCQKCHKTMEQVNFYTYKTGEKCELCKSCITMHIDNFEPDTYLWILEKMDVPYLPNEWKFILDKAYAKNPKKVNGTSVLGKYLAKMRLRQFKDYTWADSEKLQAEQAAAAQAEAEANRQQEEYIRKQYENGNITEAQYKTIVSTAYQHDHEQFSYEEQRDPIGEDNAFNEKDFLSEEEMPNLAVDLTLQDKQYLAVKWGRTYKISEWIELEKKYVEMTDSFDIQDADSKNALLLYCKTYLKINQALDCGDIESYQKLSRVLDTIRKSMKVTAAQNKEEKTEFIDSVGQLVAYCEKNGGQIPRYQIKTPYDKIDKIIDDLKLYNRTLIYGDTALSRQIEDYIKEARAAAARKRDKEEAKAKGLEESFLEDEQVIKLKQFIQEQKDLDAIDEGSEVEHDSD